jgi:hypothetical protein
MFLPDVLPLTAAPHAVHRSALFPSHHGYLHLPVLHGMRLQCLFCLVLLLSNFGCASVVGLHQKIRPKDDSVYSCDEPIPMESAWNLVRAQETPWSIRPGGHLAPVHCFAYHRVVIHRAVIGYWAAHPSKWKHKAEVPPAWVVLSMADPISTLCVCNQLYDAVSGLVLDRPARSLSGSSNSPSFIPLPYLTSPQPTPFQTQ